MQSASISLLVVAFAVIIGFLDENSLVRRFGYEREISQLKEEIEKVPGRLRREHQTSQRTKYSNPDAIEQIAREKVSDEEAERRYLRF